MTARRDGRAGADGNDRGPTAPADSAFDPVATGALDAPLPSWRLGATLRQRLGLAAFTLLGLVALGLLVAALARTPHLDATWRPTPEGEVELVRSDDPALAPHERKLLVGVNVDGVTRLIVDARLLRRSARWTLDDLDRAIQRVATVQLNDALRRPVVGLAFDDGSVAEVHPHPRGWTSLPLLFWLLCTFALGLHLVAAAAVLAGCALRNCVYAAMAWCQAVNLATIAVETTLELGLPKPFALIDMPLRMGLDLATAAAMVVAVGLFPRRLPGALAIGGAAVLGAAALVTLYLAGRLPHAWWWTQAGVAACGMAVVGVLTASYQREANPFALVLRRFAVLGVATWVLLTAAIASAHSMQQLPHDGADLGSMVWYVFLAALLMLAPFLVRTHAALREFALLAAISTVATSLNLLFVSMLAFSPVAALTLSLFVSLTVYSGARPWLMRQLLGSSGIATDHLFERLYRVARAVHAEPLRTSTLVTRLVGDLFEPLEIRQVDRTLARSRVASDGSGLMVPLPRIVGGSEKDGAVLMRFAQRGRRLFSAEDARLADRIVEQLQHAVSFDSAVEQGRHEERLRLAQDLHDDIGARLLTLMYQAQSPELEDYLRHTLLDLKTLTRGLAAPDHRLSHAVAEWKADLTQRLEAARIEARFAFAYDDDLRLSVGQWSALTRVLRELVSNTIGHADATWLEVDFRLQGDRLELSVIDDGGGTDPAGWAPGLGLGGVRKRVRQLGGSVRWSAAEPRGIACRVVVAAFSAAP